jgi:hypothetical protein
VCLCVCGGGGSFIAHSLGNSVEYFIQIFELLYFGIRQGSFDAGGGGGMPVVRPVPTQNNTKYSVSP